MYFRLGVSNTPREKKETVEVKRTHNLNIYAGVVEQLEQIGQSLWPVFWDEASEQPSDDGAGGLSNFVGRILQGFKDVGLEVSNGVWRQGGESTSEVGDYKVASDEPVFYRYAIRSRGAEQVGEVLDEVGQIIECLQSAGCFPLGLVVCRPTLLELGVRVGGKGGVAGRRPG